MIRLLIILLVTSQVDLKVQTVQYRMHVSRKSRSDSGPTKTGYVYSQVNNNPGTLATFGDTTIGYNFPSTRNVYVGLNSDSLQTIPSDLYTEKYSDKLTTKINFYPNDRSSEVLTKHNDSSIGNYKEMPSDKMVKYDIAMPEYSAIEKYGDKLSREIETPLSRYSDEAEIINPPQKYVSSSVIEPALAYIGSTMAPSSFEYDISKADTNYDTKFLPSKLKSDAIYERLKSLMYYSPSPDSVKEFGYDTIQDFHVDDDDVRTSSRTTYGAWPYFYHNPYEYEQMKVGSNIQKAKDKRYAVDVTHKIIPVHEDVDYDMPDPHRTSTEQYFTTQDNPNHGNQPFFSFVLNDYFEKNNEEDPLSFKGLDWGKDFDYESNFQESDSDYNDDYGKRNRRLQSNYYPTQTQATITHRLDKGQAAHGESATEKSYERKHEFDKHEKGNEETSNQKAAYEQNGNNQKAFKDFVDTFTNKFGSEDHKKDSKLILKHNQDKGEKRKGFRRVYHKDEYQEDNEFYDNKNHSVNGEENGSTAAHAGGSEALLQSHAATASGSEANAHSKAGNSISNRFDKNHRGHILGKGLDRDLSRYRDEAKKTAHINNANYHDH